MMSYHFPADGNCLRKEGTLVAIISKDRLEVMTLHWKSYFDED